MNATLFEYLFLLAAYHWIAIGTWSLYHAIREADRRNYRLHASTTERCRLYALRTARRRLRKSPRAMASRLLRSLEKGIRRLLKRDRAANRSKNQRKITLIPTRTKMSSKNRTAYDVTIHTGVGNFTDRFVSQNDMLTAVRALVDLPATTCIVITPTTEAPTTED